MLNFWGSTPRFDATVFVIFCFFTTATYAGALPIDRSAQELLLQQEREKQLQQQQQIPVDVRLQTGAQENVIDSYPDDESPCFQINKVTLTGEAASEFQFALASVLSSKVPAIGRCLGAEGINLAMSRVQNVILAKGFVTTRILAAPQDLNTGELVLTVVPGKVRSVRFAEGVTPRATAWNALPIRSGDILNLRDIEQGLENLKRLPSAEADIQITPADGADAGPGESDLVIHYQQRFPFRLTFSADDAGFDSTGKYQGGITLSGDHLLMLNDLFYVNYNHDLGGGDSGKRGSEGYSLHYSLPLGYWLLGFTASNYDYHQVVAGQNQSYVYSGRSMNSELKASRLVFRNAINKSVVSLSGFFKKSSNFIDDTEIEVQRRRTAGWELGFQQTWYLGQSLLDYHLSYRRGTGAMNALIAPEEAFDEGTSRMEVVFADISLQHPLAIPSPWGEQTLIYSGNLRSQYNLTPLTPQDRFSIGNRYTVRGFDGQLNLSADRGWFVRNDLSAMLGKTNQAAYIGLDYGEVDGQSSNLLLGRRLAGAVVGIRGGYRGFSYDVFLGKGLKKPKGFETASTAAGFNLNWTF